MQWRIQDFHKGDAEQWVWGTEVPQQGPGAEHRWGLGAKPPEARDIMLHSRLITSENFNIKELTTRQKHVKKLSLCGPVKANLSTTSTGSIGVVCACTSISANDVSRSSPIDDRLRVEKERSGVAVVTGKVTSTCSRMDRFGYRDALHAVHMHPVGLQSSVVPLQHVSVASTAQTRLGACRDCRR